MSTRIVTIDCEYVRPRFAAAYLLISGGEAAFVDNNTSHSVPKLLKALEENGLKPSDVRLIIVTHVHLDHAGGTSRLAEACADATVLAHPRAARHIIDPSRLIASSRKVYGDAIYEQLYGRIDPVPQERVREMSDEEVLSFGETRLRFLHTRGHANHHFCILDEEAKAIFTGDAFGLRYPDIQDSGPFIFPSTSPTDFDPVTAKQSVRRIAGSGAQVAYPTHFGAVNDLEKASTQLIRHLEFSENLLEEIVQQGPESPEAYCKQRLNDYFRNVFASMGTDPEKHPEKYAEYIQLDLELNAAGIAFAAGRLRAARE